MEEREQPWGEPVVLEAEKVVSIPGYATRVGADDSSLKPNRLCILNSVPVYTHHKVHLFVTPNLVTFLHSQSKF